MSTLKTHNLQSPDSGSSNIALTPNAGMVVSGISTFSNSLDINAAANISGDLTIADKVVHDGDTDTAIRFPAADTFTVETGGSERFRIDSTGNTLIYGVLRKDNVSSSLSISGGNGADSSANIVLHGSGGSPANVTQFRTGSTERLRIASGGNVGINTDNPSNLLHIDGGTDQLKLSDGSGSFEFRAGNVLMIKDNGTERLRIDSSGDVRLEHKVRFQYNTGSTDSRTWLVQNDLHAYGDLGFRRSTTQTGNTFETKILFKDDGGICFNGDTTAANALDDYEEGSSTVSIQNITADTNSVYMTYTKIGSVVCIVGVITIVNKTVSSGANGWFHLPFAPSAHSTSVPGCSIQKNSINTNVAYLGFYGNNTNCYFMSRSGGYQNGNSLGNGQIGFTATYTTH